MRMTREELIEKWRHVDRQSLPFAVQRPGKRLFTDEQEEMILSYLMRENAKVGDAAPWFGVSAKTLYDVCRRAEKRAEVTWIMWVGKRPRKRKRKLTAIQKLVPYRIVFRRRKRTNG
jgi:hypothetical protein